MTRPDRRRRVGGRPRPSERRERRRRRAGRDDARRRVPGVIIDRAGVDRHRPRSRSLFADWLAPYEPLSRTSAPSLQGPSTTHWLGTDQLGRDILSRLMHGGSDAIVGVLAVAVAVAALLGVPTGSSPGTRARWLDAVDVAGRRPADDDPRHRDAADRRHRRRQQPDVGDGHARRADVRRLLPARAGVRRPRSSTRLFVDASRVAGVGESRSWRCTCCRTSRAPSSSRRPSARRWRCSCRAGSASSGSAPTTDPTWGGMIYEASQAAQPVRRG